MPHGSAVYQQRCVPLPALRHHTAYGRHPAPLLPQPQFRACTAASTRERCCAPSGSPSRPVQRRTRQPFNPLSEEKAVRSLHIDRVTEKNQKQWKLWIAKTGRFYQKSSADACEAWSRKPHLQLSWIQYCAKGIQSIPLTGSIAFVTLDGALGTVCKRWYLDMDLAVEERPAASSSPASPCSRLDAP
jgi:hypothetical protein